MTSFCTPRFWACLNALPLEVRDLAGKNYQLWKTEPRHPSLHFKPLGSGYHSVRVGLHYRAIGFVEDDAISWVWIGHHSEYDRLIKKL